MSTKLELAKAYVQIIPSTKGLGKSIIKEFSDAGDDAGKAAGEAAGKSMASEYEKAIAGIDTSRSTAAAEKWSKIWKAAGKASLAAITAAATATVKIVKSSLEAYAEYEQLVGGVETLFKGSADTVQTYAANAYKTAGLSANEYMETVTSFSASLLQGLGGDTEAAAEMADLAITDMSDNANKMGTDMEAIQNAYQGFAKQNYTMLDNLKLGYGGTASEMARLINDSGVLGDSMTVTAETVNSVGFDKMIEAIHAVQTEMGITGTTALEAGATISGSLGSMQAAWSNLLVGMADESADLGGLIDNLVDSAMTFGENLIPVVEQALMGVASVVEGLAPMLVALLPGLVENILPGLLDAAMSIVDGIIAALPGLLQTVIAALLGFLPDIVQAGLDLFIGLIGALPEIITTICAALPEIITNIVSTLANNIPAIVQAGQALFISLVQNLPAIIAGIVAAIPQIISSLVRGIAGSVPQIVSAGYNLMLGLGQGIRNAVSSLWQTMVNAVNGIINGAKRLLGIRSPSTVFAEIGAYTMEGFAKGILQNEGLITDAMAEASSLATGTFSTAMTVNASALSTATPTSVSTGSVARELAEALRHVQVVMDGKRTVGYLVPEIDTALGGRRTLAGRGVL